MDPVAAAPLMYAGVTVFNSLRNNNDKAKPPAIVAVVGYVVSKAESLYIFIIGRGDETTFFLFVCLFERSMHPCVSSVPLMAAIAVDS